MKQSPPRIPGTHTKGNAVDSALYPKLADNGCRCPCNFVHPDAYLCQLTAHHSVLYKMFNEDLHMPMCRPCADTYQRRFIYENIINESPIASGVYDDAD